MAKSFTSIKDPKLQLTDKLTFGKFKDCRLCDIIQDHYEYLIWAEKQGYCVFHKEVANLIIEQANFERWEEPKEEKTVEDLYESLKRRSLVILEDDVPF